MKKLLVGCLIIVVLGAVALGVGAYFLYRAASPMVESARGYLERVSQLGELEKEIRNTAAYRAPQNGELTKEQVDRFARVQQHVRGSLGQRMDEIEAKYKHLKANADTRTEPSFAQVVSALGDLASVVIDARRLQVNALNQENFSSAEYAWVRSRVYQAAGVVMASVIDFQKMAEAARRGTGIESLDVPQTPSIEVPEKNRELIKPYMERMDQWLPLAFFGL